MKRILVFSTLVAAAVAGHAADITIYNTGVANDLSLLADGMADGHWTLSSNPGEYTSTAYTLNSSTYPQNPYWNLSGSASKWIQPGSGSNNTHMIGEYRYTQNFDLSGYLPNTAQLKLRYAADNEVSDVLLNGVSLGLGNHVGFSFSDWKTINSGFVSGVNALTIVTTNYNDTTSYNPTGVRAEVMGTVEAVPEPTTTAVLGLGVAAFLRRRKKK